MNEDHLIIGAGFLGTVLAKRLEGRVWSTRRKPISELLESQICLDVNQPETWNSLDRFKSVESLNVYCLIPPSKIDLTQLPQCLSKLKHCEVRRAILVSSTVVYGKAAREVDADSEVLLDSPRAEKQYAIEQVWKEQFASESSVVRLAGLYGIGRVIGQNSLLAGNAIGGDANGYLNLIHAEDAASLLQTISHQENTAASELGCDDMPVKRSEYYGKLAALLGVNAPEFVENSARGGNRFCSNTLTKQRTGWQPQYPNSLQAIEDLI